MRYAQSVLAGPLTLIMAGALAGCNMLGGSDESSKATREARVEATTSAESSAATPAAPAASTSSGGKSSAASTTTRTASNNTDAKGNASNGGGNQCTDNNDRHVVVRNDTQTTLFRLYGSNVNRSSWEEDVLGSDVLAAGQSINVNWDDGSCECMFDFKAEFSDGTETVRRGFNVCTESQWRIVE